ncbi:MAG TPA: 30S ribosomal protein S21 [Candidatus Paceibacterota bacterium]
MQVNVEVSKQSNESTTSLIRRFTKRVQGSGILRHSRKIRYHARAASKSVRKKQALKLLGKRAAYEELAKLGKLPPEPVRRGR